MSYEIDEFKSDTPRVWIGFVEIVASPQCDEQEMREAAGAFTSALAWTHDADNFCDQVEAACAEQQWTIKNISSVRTFDVSDWDNNEHQKEILVLAQEVMKTQELHFDILHLFADADDEWNILEQAITDIGYWSWWAEY